MKISTAIDQARTMSSLSTFGNQYQVIYFHGGYTTSSNSMDYHMARQHRARDVATQALILMGYDEYDAGFSCHDLTGSIEHIAEVALSRMA